MQSPATDTRTTTRTAPPPVKTPHLADPTVEPRAELLALNELLRERKSVDHGLRAYLGAWGAFLSVSIAGKLAYDSLKTPWVALPLAFLGLVLVADVVAQKRLQWRLARVEELQLARQRELRGLLGLDEAVLPVEAPLGAAPVVARA